MDPADHHPWSMCLSQSFCLKTDTPLCFFQACILCFCVSICIYFRKLTLIEGPLVNTSKYGPSAQMTMPARRASNCCLISCVIPGMIEPYPECQPERSWE